MESSDQEGIEEVFAIQTDAIDFFGALVKEKAGKSGVHGRILFQDGKQWYFHYPADERAVVRNKLVHLSEAIAKFYGTDLFCHKFDETIAYGEFIHLLRAAKRILN
jgi:Leu/Phe-tRNA-protein transferase